MENLISEILNGKQITKVEALELFDIDLEDIFLASSKIWKKQMCQDKSLFNCKRKKSGQCSENCKFCAQSSFNKTDVKIYPLVDPEKIKEVSMQALENVGCFGIVSSGVL